MTFAPKAGRALAPCVRSGYKWLDALATYEPCSPYPSTGRFGNGDHKTVYVADSARGAMAEYFRRHPEFLNLQDDLVITLYELDLQIAGQCLDTCEDGSRSRIGISEDQLTSSDADEEVRYRDCRELASETIAAGFVGILYPSASASWPGAQNLVLFHDQTPSTWQCDGHRAIDRPCLTAAEVHPL